jgi:hypothetical protein
MDYIQLPFDQRDTILKISGFDTHLKLSINSIVSSFFDREDNKIILLNQILFNIIYKLSMTKKTVEDLYKELDNKSKNKYIQKEDLIKTLQDFMIRKEDIEGLINNWEYKDNLEAINIDDLTNHLKQREIIINDIIDINNELKFGNDIGINIEYNLNEKDESANESKSEYSIKNNKNEKNKEITKTPDRNRMKFASGSNFEIINLECGVKLIENQKIKTGGKDFFRKYGRCSFEIFQEQLNRTSSGYYHNDNNNYINVNINDNENDSNIKNDIKQDNSGLPYIFKKKFKKEKSDYDILNTMPNSSNNYLNLKTTNLKAALNNLDLINEDRLREFAKKSEDNNNENILNNTKDKKLEKKDYGEINKFNKTLLKNKLWGEPTDSFQTQYMRRMFPIKPEQKYLLRDLSKNELNYSPRKRLPPLATTQRTFQTQIDKNESGKNIKNKRPINKKLKELKNKNLSKDDIYNNKRKNFFSTTNSYYNNTEKGLSPIIKI